MIYILMFIIGCLLIKMSNLNKMIKVYKNNYLTALQILGEYDPKLKEYLERWNKNMDKGKIAYWKWKNTIIDFDTISNETIDY